MQSDHDPFHQVQMPTGDLADAALVSPAEQEIEVSFVLPCLNEAATLVACIQQVHEAINLSNVKAEIIIADNGSTDGSIEISRACGVVVQTVPLKGYGVALAHGVRAARGRYVVIGDSDGSYDFRESLAMIDLLRAGCDLVVGSRFKGTIRPGAMPWKNRYLGNPFLTGVLNLFYPSGLSDAHCGLRALRTECFCSLNLRCTGMEFATEMIVRATMLNLKRAEIPVTYYRDGRNRKSHLNPWRDGWRHLRFLLLYAPGWLYLWPGFVLCALGVSLNTALTLLPDSVFIIIGSVFFGSHWAVPATIAAVFGLQLILLGIFTEVYALRRSWRAPPRWLSLFMRLFSLESGLLLGLLTLMVGTGLELSILLHWILSRFGELAAFRTALYGLMWLLVGAELIMNSLFLSMLVDDLGS